MTDYIKQVAEAVREECARAAADDSLRKIDLDAIIASVPAPEPFGYWYEATNPLLAESHFSKEHPSTFSEQELADAEVVVMRLYTAPVGTPNPWHDAILAECMRIECAYAEADPAGTVARLIDWHVKNAAAPVGVSVPQWQPIETAPRGSGEEGPGDVRHPEYVQPPSLLLATPEGIVVGYYDWYYHEGYGNGYEPGVSAWRTTDGEQAYSPTHWMPLPEAPK